MACIVFYLLVRKSLEQQLRPAFRKLSATTEGEACSDVGLLYFKKISSPISHLHICVNGKRWESGTKQDPK